MAPGTIFTMANERYRYLENMGNSNHMIIREDAIRHARFHNQDTFNNTWYGNLDPAVQAMVQPVADHFDTGSVALEGLTWSDNSAVNIPTNLHEFPAVDEDITQVDPSGTPRAFSLSMADVIRIFADRGSRTISVPRTAFWMLRTPAAPGNGWLISMGGWFTGDLADTWGGSAGGTRPALIVRQ
ncbi:MAG TPA: hypothetical protein DCR07_03370 [Lactococcus sp.]|nr:hypothetical protein [Lactococcus sp.]